MKRDKQLYTASYVLRTLGLGIFTTLFNVYILEFAKLSSEFLAEFLTIGNMSMAVSSYFIGILIDKYEKKILLICFTLICAFCFATEIMIRNESFLYMISVLYGIGATGLLTLNAPVLKIYEKSDNDNLLIIYRAINILAVTIGALIAGLLTGDEFNVSTQSVLLSVPILYLIAAVILAFHSNIFGKDELKKEWIQKQIQMETEFPRDIFIITAIVFLFLGFAPLLSNYINVYFKERFELSISNVAYVYALINFLSGIAILVCSKVNFRKRRNALIFVTAIIADNLVLIFCPVVSVQVIGVFVYLFLYEIIMSVVCDFILTVGEKRYHGRLSGVIQAASNLSESLGIYVCGMLIGIKFFNIIFVLSIFATAIGAVIMLGLIVRKGGFGWNWKNE